MRNIPLSVPSLKGNEIKYLQECIDTEWVSSAGKHVELFEAKIAKYMRSKYAVACVSGTSSLQVSLRLSNVVPGDEVIVPSLTFIASVNAIAYNGAVPIFMDSGDDYNLDIEKTIQFITKETYIKSGYSYNKTTHKKIAAIVVVHVWGNAARLDLLVALCGERQIIIVEDASESLGTYYTKGENAGRHAGTVGTFGCLSFNGNKIITTGGGGMILTNDKKLADKARYLITQANDDPVRYVHNQIGYNFRLTNIQAALGLAQLEQLTGFLKRKKMIHTKYRNGIMGNKGLSIAVVPDYAENNHWMNVLKLDSRVCGEDRDAIMNRLGTKGIQTRPIWTLNHKQKPYINSQAYKIEKADNLVSFSLCLPSSSNMSDEHIDYVISQLNV